MKRILEGLQILIKYFPNGGVSAEHDVIFAGGEIDDVEISEEDKQALDKLGWFVDDEYDCYTHFT